MELRNIQLGSSKYDINLNKGIYEIKCEDYIVAHSLMEKIVFTKNVDEQRNFFSYVPKHSIVYDISVYDYITDYDSKKLSRCKELIRIFKVYGINEKTNIDILSEEDAKKCNLIRALIRDTPYLFLDEITYHMDNAEVQDIQNLLFDYCKDKCLVIINTDERFKIEPNYEIKLSDNNLEVVPLSETENVNIPPTHDSQGGVQNFLVIRSLCENSPYLLGKFTAVMLIYILQQVWLYEQSFSSEIIEKYNYFGSLSIFLTFCSWIIYAFVSYLLYKNLSPLRRDLYNTILDKRKVDFGFIVLEIIGFSVIGLYIFIALYGNFIAVISLVEIIGLLVISVATFHKSK